MKLLRRRALSAAMVFLVASGALARGAEDFKGKTVTVVIGFAPGGAYDLYGRLFARFLGAHLPGEPNVVAQNMPGAGGLVAANYLYNVAPHDGATVGVISQTAAIGQVLDTPGVRYDVRKLGWIGRLSSNAQLLHTWYTSRTKTIADAMAHQVILAGTGPTSSSVVFPRIMNDLLGTKFKVVTGFTSETPATLAMERGEVEGVVRPWAQIKAANPDWIRDKKINPLVFYALSRQPDLPDVPAIVDLAHDQAQRQLLALFASGDDVGNAIVAPPGLASSTLETLRKAFDQVTADQAYIAAAHRAKLDPDPLPGGKLQMLNDSTFDVSTDVVERAKKYSSGK